LARIHGGLSDADLQQVMNMSEHQQHVDAVAAAATVLTELEAKHAALREYGRELVQRRQEVSYDAHIGDAAAKKKLEAIIGQITTHDQQVLSAEAAIVEAQARLAAAGAAETQEITRANAVEISKINDSMREHGRELGDVLHDLVEAVSQLKTCFDQFNQRGVASPHSQQLKVNVVAAISGALSGLPYEFATLHFRFLPAHERPHADVLFRKWHAAIEDRYVRPHLGEAEQQITESADVAA
jgi:hypothetical protein